MIPKKIHYCWFGKNPKPEIIKKCIESWEHYCPEWEIIEWNEENFDVTANVYMKEAYEMKKWAFVSDVARLMVIYQFGGVYLDTDVELLQSIDELVNDEAFFVFETCRNVNSGMGFGAIKGQKVVLEMIKKYENKYFLINGKAQLIPCPAGNTEALEKYCSCFERNGKAQKFEGVRILSGEEYSKYAIHHGTATWVTGPEREQRTYRSSKMKNIIRNPIIFEKLKKYLGKPELKYTLGLPMI